MIRTKQRWTTKGKSPVEIATVARTSEDTTVLRLILDENTDPRIWRALAANPALPTDLYRHLANVPDARTQEAVAVQERTPARVLNALSSRSDRLARLVAYNPATTGSRLRILSRHGNATVRAGVGWNWNTPTAVLAALCSDPDRRVLLRVMKNGNTPTAGRMVLAESEDNEIALWLAGNQMTEEDVLELLSSHPDPAVRSKVAWNKNTPDRIRVLLATDSVETVRIDVARNWDTPDEAFDLLRADRSDAVRWFVSKNQSAPQLRTSS